MKFKYIFLHFPTTAISFTIEKNLSIFPRRTYSLSQPERNKPFWKEI